MDYNKQSYFLSAAVLLLLLLGTNVWLRSTGEGEGDASIVLEEYPSGALSDEEVAALEVSGPSADLERLGDPNIEIWKDPITGCQYLVGDFGPQGFTMIPRLAGYGRGIMGCMIPLQLDRGKPSGMQTF